MKVVFIAHPIGGDVKGNLKKIARLVRLINLQTKDIVPFVPYYSDCMALNDELPRHRARGIANNLEHFKRKSFDELWLCGPEITQGMRDEIAEAQKCGIPVRRMILRENELLLREYDKDKDGI